MPMSPVETISMRLSFINEEYATDRFLLERIFAKEIQHVKTNYLPDGGSGLPVLEVFVFTLGDVDKINQILKTYYNPPLSENGLFQISVTAIQRVKPEVFFEFVKEQLDNFRIKAGIENRPLADSHEHKVVITCGSDEERQRVFNIFVVNCNTKYL